MEENFFPLSGPVPGDVRNPNNGANSIPLIKKSIVFFFFMVSVFRKQLFGAPPGFFPRRFFLRPPQTKFFFVPGLWGFHQGKTRFIAKPENGKIAVVPPNSYGFFLDLQNQKIVAPPGKPRRGAPGKKTINVHRIAKFFKFLNHAKTLSCLSRLTPYVVSPRPWKFVFPPTSPPVLGGVFGNLNLQFKVKGTRFFVFFFFPKGPRTKTFS